MDTNNSRPEVALVHRKVAELAEHYEAVQVLVSTYERGKTCFMFAGSGNEFARRGMAQEWLEMTTESEPAEG